LTIKRNIATGENCSDSEHSNSSSDSDNLDKAYADEIHKQHYELVDFDSINGNLIREGYMYGTKGAYKEGRNSTMFQKYICNDKNTLGCVGVWEVQPLLFNGEYGRLVVPHSEPKEKHRFSYTDGEYDYVHDVDDSYMKNKDTKLTLPQARHLVKRIAKEDPSITPGQLMAKIKRIFPNTPIYSRRMVESAIDRTRMRLTTENALTTLSVNPAKILTLRKTQFGRGSTFCMIDGKPRQFMYFYSDFQKMVVDEVRNDPYLHLFIDGTFK
jgi:hypothetical protein